jgi:hypothetical protein
MKLLISVALTAFIPLQAYAFCSEPSENIDFPDPPGSISRPSVPFCLSSYKYSGTHTCDQWEIDSYQRKIRDYVSELQTFMSEAYDAAKEAADFATEAEEYARCEADDVASQFK